MWIRLKNIQVYAYHGVYPHERVHGTRFEIDVELEPISNSAIISDNVIDAIDYVKVQQEVVAISTSKRFNLIESLCDAIASRIIFTFPVGEVIVRVRKPGASAGVVLDTVEVECRKTR